MANKQLVSRRVAYHIVEELVDGRLLAGYGSDSPPQGFFDQVVLHAKIRGDVKRVYVEKRVYRKRKSSPYNDKLLRSSVVESEEVQ